MYVTFPGMFTTADERGAFSRLADAVRLVRFGGDCYSYCLLALGFVDLVVEASLQAYDIVPLIPIVHAAGGVVSDADGRLPLDGGFVVAATNTQASPSARLDQRGVALSAERATRAVHARSIWRMRAGYTTQYRNGLMSAM